MAMDCGLEVEENKEDSGTSTTGVSNKDESSAAEAHELLNDHLQHEFEFQEAGQEEAREHNDDYSDSGTDTDLPLLVRRQKNDASSDNSSSDGSYTHNTDNDNSSIEDSDNDSTTVSGLQERCRNDSGSDGECVPCQGEGNTYPQPAKMIP